MRGAGATSFVFVELRRAPFTTLNWGGLGGKRGAPHATTNTTMMMVNIHEELQSKTKIWTRIPVIERMKVTHIEKDKENETKKRKGTIFEIATK